MEQLAGDQEARDHEENVDADVAARQAQRSVRQHDGNHRNSAQALDVGAEFARRYVVRVPARAQATIVALVI
jgi:hypothetical protein